MSIDPGTAKSPKVREDLNLFFTSGAPLVIKVLTDLENEPDTFFYRHIGPEGPSGKRKARRLPAREGLGQMAATVTQPTAAAR